MNQRHAGGCLLWRSVTFFIMQIDQISGQWRGGIRLKKVIQLNLSSRDTVTRGQPVIRGHFLRTVSYLPHVKEPVTKGHLSCRDTFSRILRCPLKTGFTVQLNLSSMDTLLRGHPLIRGHFLRTIYFPHMLKKSWDEGTPVLWGHIIWDIEESPDDGFRCTYKSLVYEHCRIILRIYWALRYQVVFCDTQAINYNQLKCTNY